MSSNKPADQDLGPRLPREDPLVEAIGQLTFVVTAMLNRYGSDNDLSLTQLRVLAVLHDRDRVGVTALANYLGLEKSSMTGLVDRGVSRGLLRRESNPDDGRAVDIVLTPAGFDLAEHIYTDFANALEAPIGVFTASERHRFNSFMRRLLDAPWPRQATGT